MPGPRLCRRRNRCTRSRSYHQSDDENEQGTAGRMVTTGRRSAQLDRRAPNIRHSAARRTREQDKPERPSLSTNERVRWSPVAAGSQLPESLKRLVEAWQMEGASRDEIVGRLDQLDLLAHEERIRLMIELLSPT